VKYLYVAFEASSIAVHEHDFDVDAYCHWRKWARSWSGKDANLYRFAEPKCEHLASCTDGEVWPKTRQHFPKPTPMERLAAVSLQEDEET
jgi:hypothetical protein